MQKLLMQGGGFDTLGLIIKQKMYHFKNVEAMKSCLTLIAGDVVQTLGYYEENDGGAGVYEIVNDSSLEEDECIIYEINNNLKARLITATVMKAEQLGFKGNDLTFDNNTVYEKLAENSTHKFTIQFGPKTYAWSQTCITNNNFNFNGIKSHFDSGIGTQFVPFTSNQPYIMKIGGYNDMHTPSVLNEVYFTGFSFTNISFSDNRADISKPVTNYLFGVEYCAGIFLDLSFMESANTNVYFRNCWEIDIENLYIRKCTASISKSLIYFDDVLSDNSSNTSRLFFKNVDCESFSCKLISCNTNPNMTNILFDSISVENQRSNLIGGVITNRSDFDNAILLPLIDLRKINGLTINSINLHRFCTRYFYVEGSSTKYIDSIFRFNSQFNISIGQINLNDCGGFIQLVDGNGGNLGQCIINSIINPYALNYYGGTHSQPGETLFNDLYSNVTYGSIMVTNTNCLINPGKNGVAILDPKLYKNANCYKLTPCQYTGFQLTFDEYANDYVAIRDFQSDPATYKQFTRRLKIPYKAKIYIRSRGSFDKITCHKVLNNEETTSAIERGTTNPSTYKDYVFDITPTDHDYIYFTAPNNNTFYLESIEVIRSF